MAKDGITEAYTPGIWYADRLAVMQCAKDNNTYVLLVLTKSDGSCEYCDKANAHIWSKELFLKWALDSNIYLLKGDYSAELGTLLKETFEYFRAKFFSDSVTFPTMLVLDGNEDMVGYSYVHGGTVSSGKGVVTSKTGDVKYGYFIRVYDAEGVPSGYIPELSFSKWTTDIGVATGADLFSFMLHQENSNAEKAYEIDLNSLISTIKNTGVKNSLYAIDLYYKDYGTAGRHQSFCSKQFNWYKVELEKLCTYTLKILANGIAKDGIDSINSCAMFILKADKTSFESYSLIESSAIHKIKFSEYNGIQYEFTVPYTATYYLCAARADVVPEKASTNMLLCEYEFIINAKDKPEYDTGKWIKSWDDAKKIALQNKRFMLIDWGKSAGCGFCNSALEHIFNTEEFKQWSKDNGIPLLYIDDLDSTQTIGGRKLSDWIHENYFNSREVTFPYIIMLDPSKEEKKDVPLCISRNVLIGSGLVFVNGGNNSTYYNTALSHEGECSNSYYISPFNPSMTISMILYIFSLINKKPGYAVEITIDSKLGLFNDYGIRTLRCRNEWFSNILIPRIKLVAHESCQFNWFKFKGDAGKSYTISISDYVDTEDGGKCLIFDDEQKALLITTYQEALANCSSESKMSSRNIQFTLKSNGYTYILFTRKDDVQEEFESTKGEKFIGYHEFDLEYAFTLTLAKSVYYTVTFKDYDGRTINTLQVQRGNEPAIPVDPQREGYTFIEWSPTPDKVYNDTEYQALYEINLYDVVFKDYDGTMLKTTKVNYGGTANAPTPPSRPGYNFDGWVPSNVNIKNDTTCIATYKAKGNDKIAVDDEALQGCVLLEAFDYGNISSIGSSAFYDCRSLTSVSDVDATIISDYAFCNCYNLPKLDIGNECKNIGPYAFYNCLKLASIDKLNSEDISNAFNKVGKYAFSKSGLKSANLILNSSVADTYWGSHCFEDCKELKKVQFFKSMYLSNYMFKGCSKLETVIFPSGLPCNYVGKYVFDSCTGLKHVTFTDSLYSFLKGYFNNCSSLTYIEFENYDNCGFRYVLKYAFANCTKLMDLKFPSSLNSINKLDDACLSNCNSLMYIDFYGIDSKELFLSSGYDEDIRYGRFIYFFCLAGSTKVDYYSSTYNVKTLIEGISRFDNLIDTLEKRNVPYCIIFDSYWLENIVGCWNDYDIRSGSTTLYYMYLSGTKLNIRDHLESSCSCKKAVFIRISDWIGKKNYDEMEPLHRTYDDEEINAALKESFNVRKNLNSQKKDDEDFLLHVMKKTKMMSMHDYLTMSDSIDKHALIIYKKPDYSTKKSALLIKSNEALENTSLFKNIENTSSSYSMCIEAYELINDYVALTGLFRLRHNCDLQFKDGSIILYKYDASKELPYVEPYEYPSDKETKSNFKVAKDLAAEGKEVWYYNAKEIKQYAEANNIPLLIVHSYETCTPCLQYLKYIHMDEEFLNWAKKQNFLLCRLEAEDTKDDDEELRYCMEDLRNGALDYDPAGKGDVLQFNAFGDTRDLSKLIAGFYGPYTYMPPAMTFYYKSSNGTLKSYFIYSLHSLFNSLFDYLKTLPDNIILMIKSLCLYHFDDNNLASALHVVDAGKEFNKNDYDVDVTNPYLKEEDLIYIDDWDRILHVEKTVENVMSAMKIILGEEITTASSLYPEHIGGCLFGDIEWINVTFDSIIQSMQEASEINEELNRFYILIGNKYYKMQVSTNAKDKVENIETPCGWSNIFRYLFNEVEYKPTPTSKCTLSFNGNGNTSGTMQNIEVDKGETIVVPACLFLRSGYSFVKWNTSADGKGTSYNKGDSIAMTSNMTLYAIWEEEQEDPFEGNSVLLVTVGIADFLSESIRSLPMIYTDTEKMKSMVKKASPKATIIQLTNEQATYSKVKESLAKSKDFDYLIFHYSGHGDTLGTKDYSKKGNVAPETTTLGIYMYDSIPDFTTKTLGTNVLLDSEIWNYLQLPKKRAFFICASCHAGGMYKAINPSVSSDVQEQNANGLQLFGFDAYVFALKMTEPSAMNNGMLMASSNDVNNILVFSACNDLQVSFHHPTGDGIGRQYGHDMMCKMKYKYDKTDGNISYYDMWHNTVNGYEPLSAWYKYEGKDITYNINPQEIMFGKDFRDRTMFT